MFRRIINFLIWLAVLLQVWLTAYAFYSYNSSIKDPLIKQISKNIVVELPEYYTYTVDNAYLTSFILKTWVFKLDKTVTLDWFYHKDWLPLAFNYCSLLKTDAFAVWNDFDNDWIPDIKDNFPYDFSNWDYSIRKDTELDFDNDWIPNAHDKDSDWNLVDDIFQWICMDRITNADQIKKLYPKKAKDLFITNKDEVIYKLNEIVYDFLDTYKIEIPFDTDEHSDDFIQNIFDKLLFEDNIIIEFWDKSLIIEKKTIISSLNNEDLDNYTE